MPTQIPHLVEGTFQDLSLLARQYFQLTKVKTRHNAKLAVAGGAFAVLATSFAVIGACEWVVYLGMRVAGLTGALLAATAWSAFFTWLLTACFALAAYGAFKKINAGPLGRAQHKETQLWPSTTTTNL